MEEEVTISKRPVIKEEVRISKERTTTERPVEGEVRKEEVKIEGDERLRKKGAA
jgi:stress response protein YsnF